MTIPRTGPLSIASLKSLTGSTANDLGSYYRGSNKTGWSPTSGTISFGNLLGGYTLVSRTSSSYNYSGYYGSDCLSNYYAGTSATGTPVYASYMGYGNIMTWGGPSSTSSTSYAHAYTVQRSVFSGWPAVNGGTYGQYHPGGMMPIGATGESGTERIYIFRMNCSVSASGYGYYYSDNYYVEINYNQAPNSSYIWYGYNVSGTNDGIYSWISNSNYGFGLRIDTGGTLYLGRYNWPSSASDPVYVWQEIAMFGSYSTNPSNQYSFGFAARTATYDPYGYGASVNFSLYPYQVWQKNCYNEDGWIDINGGAGTQVYNGSPAFLSVF